MFVFVSLCAYVQVFYSLIFSFVCVLGRYICVYGCMDTTHVYIRVCEYEKLKSRFIPQELQRRGFLLAPLAL